MDDTEIVCSLQRIEDLLSVLVKAQLSESIERELSNPKMKKLYNLTGDRTARALVKELNCSFSTIANAWKRWEQLGFIIKDGKRYRKIFD